MYGTPPNWTPATPHYPSSVQPQSQSMDLPWLDNESGMPDLFYSPQFTPSQFNPSLGNQSLNYKNTPDNLTPTAFQPPYNSLYDGFLPGNATAYAYQQDSDVEEDNNKNSRVVKRQRPTNPTPTPTPTATQPKPTVTIDIDADDMVIDSHSLPNRPTKKTNPGQMVSGSLDHSTRPTSAQLTRPISAQLTKPTSTQHTKPTSTQVFVSNPSPQSAPQSAPQPNQLTLQFNTSSIQQKKRPEQPDTATQLSLIHDYLTEIEKELNSVEKNNTSKREFSPIESNKATDNYILGLRSEANAMLDDLERDEVDKKWRLMQEIAAEANKTLHPNEKNGEANADSTHAKKKAKRWNFI